MSVVDHHLRKAKQKWGELLRTLQAARKEIDRLENEQQRYQTKMKVTDIAEYLGVSRRTVYNMLEDGRLASRKMIDVRELKTKL